MMKATTVNAAPPDVSRTLSRAKSRKTGRMIGHNVIIAVLAVVWLIPIIWLVCTAFSAQSGMNTSTFFPAEWSVTHFVKLFQPDTVNQFPRWFMNTLIIACATCVISTCFTESTRCYPNLIGQKAPDKTVISHGCPDLAKLVEANLGDPKGQEVIEEDLKKNMDELVHKHKIDCCVLGCTHYPLVSENINHLYPELPLVDPAVQMAKTIGAYMEEKGLTNDQPGQGTLDIYTTASVEEYREKAAKVGLKVTSVQDYPIFKL